MNYSVPPPPKKWESTMPEEKGVALLSEGRVGVILLAGGLGSRLKWKGAKGTFLITPVRDRTLFELFGDKVDAASGKFGHQIPVAVMTSRENHEETVASLNRPDWDFCQQKELPFLDKDRKPLPFFGPDGNGGVFEVLFEAGVLEKWKRQGVTVVTTLLIDNPLADPVDPRWIEFHLNGDYDLTLKVVEKIYSEEKVGHLVETEDGLRIVEYTEAVDGHALDGKDFNYGNTSLFLLTLDFAMKAALHTHSLPFHDQWKRIEGGVWGWKRERYIFDHFSLAKKIAPLLYPREETFVPLKEIDDLEKVKGALSQRERSILEAITERAVPPVVMEIDPTFYYPSTSLLNSWRGRTAPSKPFVGSEPV